MLQVMQCVVLVTFAQDRKRKRTTVQADSQGHVSHYHELMSRVWPVKGLFLTAATLHVLSIYHEKFLKKHGLQSLNKFSESVFEIF